MKKGSTLPITNAERLITSYPSNILLPVKQQILQLKCLLLSSVVLLLLINIAIVCWVAFFVNKQPQHLTTTPTLAEETNGDAKLIREFFEACFNGNSTKILSMLSTYSNVIGVNSKYDQAKHGTMVGFHGWANGTTCLHFAAARGQTDTVKMLIKQLNASVNQQEINGRTPLSMASYHGHLDIVRLICENGHADLNSKTVEGWTPLMAASWFGRFEIVDYLLKKGALVNEKDYKQGKTALGGASNDSIRQLLKNHGATE